MDWLGSDHMGTPTDVHGTMEEMFSVMRGLSRIYISELNSETRKCRVQKRSSRSTEESIVWEHNGVQRSISENKQWRTTKYIRE
jgi:hypothetical protein